MMSAIFSLFLAIFASLVLHFNHNVADKTKNDTVDEFGRKGLFVNHPRKGFPSEIVNLLGGGSGGPDDGNPPDFRPGRWRMFPSVDFDPLFWYDLQWNRPETISLFPKHWHEDEELVFAWNMILAKQRVRKLAAEVRLVPFFLYDTAFKF